jgi:hypothetical protein
MFKNLDNYGGIQQDTKLIMNFKKTLKFEKEIHSFLQHYITSSYGRSLDHFIEKDCSHILFDFVGNLKMDQSMFIQEVSWFLMTDKRVELDSEKLILSLFKWCNLERETTLELDAKKETNFVCPFCNSIQFEKSKVCHDCHNEFEQSDLTPFRDIANVLENTDWMKI